MPIDDRRLVSDGIGQEFDAGFTILRIPANVTASIGAS
jgi:hypothetical protein